MKSVHAMAKFRSAICTDVAAHQPCVMARLREKHRLGIVRATRLRISTRNNGWDEHPTQRSSAPAAHGDV